MIVVFETPVGDRPLTPTYDDAIAVLKQLFLEALRGQSLTITRRESMGGFEYLPPAFGGIVAQVKSSATAFYPTTRQMEEAFRQAAEEAGIIETA